MTLKELHFFYTLSQTPQVTLVAQELQVSQSAISLAIKSLEEKLQEKLFDRVGKKLILNERGKFFKEKTHKHYLALMDAQQLFKQNRLAGTVNIAASQTISNHIMPDIYYDFLNEYPDVKLNIHSLNSTEILQKVIDGSLDMGLIEANITHSNIVKKHLGFDELVIVSSDKTLPKEMFIDTINKKWILREVGSGTREIFTQTLGENIEFVNIFMELHSFQEIKSVLLHHNNTITAISKVAVQKELNNKELYQVRLKNIEFKREFSLIFNKNKTSSQLFTTSIEYIKEAFKKRGL